jgi:hypothetical protein
MKWNHAVWRGRFYFAGPIAPVTAHGKIRRNLFLSSRL